jgi:hypothetical protein
MCDFQITPTFQEVKLLCGVQLSGGQSIRNQMFGRSAQAPNLNSHLEYLQGYMAGNTGYIFDKMPQNHASLLQLSQLSGGV